MTEEDLRREIRSRLKLVGIGFVLLFVGLLFQSKAFIAIATVCLAIYLWKKFFGVSPYYFPEE